MIWEYGEVYKKHDMNGIIELPNNSQIQVCDWLNEMPDFMLRADTVFVDPPWNVGNINTFYTKAEKRHPGVQFLGFSAQLLNRIKDIAPNTLFIEMGKEYLGWWLQEVGKMFNYVTFYNSTYYKKRDNKCYVIHATNQHKTRRYKELEDMDEADIIAWIAANHQYKCIGDLCMGTGLVGRRAYDAGKSFVGTELNYKRLALLVEYIKEKESSKCIVEAQGTR